jgi:hypothetical protein
MSLTLVGRALTCLVAFSPRASLSAAWRARATPDRTECGVGLQQSSDRWIFPLAGDVLPAGANICGWTVTTGETVAT